MKKTEKISETKIWFFKNINKSDESLKGQGWRGLKIRSERGNITTDLREKNCKNTMNNCTTNWIT